MRRVWHMQQKIWCARVHCNANNNTFNESKPDKKLWCGSDFKGDVYDEACEYAYQLADEKGYTFIHPFDDLAVATGQGTIAMEIFKELPTVDIILVPIGGGGLAAGVSTLAKLLNPNIQVIGVEPAGASCMQASINAGEVVTLPNVETIADGTAVKTPRQMLYFHIYSRILMKL